MKVIENIKTIDPKAPDKASLSADGRRDPKLEELAEQFSASLEEKTSGEDGELPGDSQTEGAESTESLKKGEEHEAMTSPFFRGSPPGQQVQGKPLSSPSSLHGSLEGEAEKPSPKAEEGSGSGDTSRIPRGWRPTLPWIRNPESRRNEASMAFQGIQDGEDLQKAEALLQSEEVKAHESGPASFLGKESKGGKIVENDTVEAALAQMGRFSIVLEPSSSADSIRSPSTVEPLPEPVRKMVERILVEVPGTSHRQEVRIRLNDSVLPDTDIRIFRDGGRLEVQFLTGSQETRDFLSPHLSSLKEALESRQGEPVQVSVAYTGESDGGQSDGRSRGQRVVWEEYET